MEKYKATTVKTYVGHILEKFGVPLEKTKVTADILVEADMRGIFSHGINSLDILILDAIKHGCINPNASMEEVSPNENQPIRHINAQGDMGHYCAKSAVELVKKLARKFGIAKVYVFNANHFGAAAIYSEEISQEKDLTGRVTCTTPSMVKAYGGEKNRLGTNLISWSIPYLEGIVTIDMATTIHAVSGILKALVEGHALPFPVYDKEGNETTDADRFDGPEDFVKNGSMIPLGGLGKEKAKMADAGYKGTGLAMLIELDNVIGGGLSTFIDPNSRDEGRRIRQTFEAWRIDTLFPKKDALQYLSETIADIRKHGGKSMLLPGEKEHKQREISLSEGIGYTPKQIKRLERIGEKFGMAPLAK